MITEPHPSPELDDIDDRLDRAVRDHFLGRLCVDVAQEPALEEVQDERLGLTVVDIEPPADRLLVVVDAAREPVAADVADPLDARRLELDVVRAVTVRAD